MEHFLFSIIYGMSSFPLTNSYVSRWLKPPTRKDVRLHTFTHTISQIDIISRIFVPKPTEWTYLYISQVIRHISYLCFLSSLAIIYIYNCVYIYIYIYITSRPSHRDVSGAFPPIARGLLVGPPECAQWGVPGAGREGNFTRGLSWIPCGESLDEPYIKCLLDTQIALYFGITRQDWLYNIHCISAYFFNDLYKL